MSFQETEGEDLDPEGTGSVKTEVEMVRGSQEPSNARATKKPKEARKGRCSRVLEAARPC